MIAIEKRGLFDILFIFLYFHISDGPRFTRKPQSVEEEMNMQVNLTCEVDGNPMPEISWIHEKYEKKVSNGTW